MSKSVVGLILAGGQSRRMGTKDATLDKAFVKLAGKTLLAHVIDGARPQVDALVLNSSQSAEMYADFDLPLVPDQVGGFAGPLAGIHAGLVYAKQQGADWLVTWACDAPFVPVDFAAKTLEMQVKNGSEIVVAASNGRTHPVAALWSVGLFSSLEDFLAGGDRKVDLWTAKHKISTLDFATKQDGIDPFFNINRPEDLAKAEQFLNAVL